MQRDQNDSCPSISFSVIIGNILDHYDTNLYSFLAPILAPQFFPTQDPVVALILSYGIMSCSSLTKPLGVLYFAKLAWSRGPKVPLSLSLLGLAVCTTLLGCLPTHGQVGFAAPVLLGIIRAVQGFFAGGEDAITGLYLVETTPPKRRDLMSGLYQSSTVLGILLASMMGIFCASANYPNLWRVAFLLGSLTGFVGIYLRWNKLPDSHEKTKLEPIRILEILKTIRQNPLPLFKIACVSSLSYVTYAVPFVFLNSFAGLVSNISYETMMFWNTMLLIVDLILCPFFVLLIKGENRSNFMRLLAIVLGVSVIPLFTLLPGAGIEMFLLVRIWIVLLGLGFLAPMVAWFYEVTSGEERYLYKGLGHMIGTESLGRPATAICLWLWFQTGSPLAPAAYIAFVSGVAVLGLTAGRKSWQTTSNPSPQTRLMQ